VVYTDGGCKGNPGPGGWAYIMRFGERYREAWGGKLQTTNNRMELTAVISALSFLKERIDAVRASCIRRNIPLPNWVGAPVRIFTDSKYVKNGISEWIDSWKKRGWKTTAKKTVLNRDLWETLDILCTELTPQFEWVEGHAGNPDNERCDTLVGQAVKELLQQVAPAVYHESEKEDTATDAPIQFD